MNFANILAIKTRGLGDTLLATPALRALRRAFPDARLTMVAAPAGREVLEGNPDIDEIRVCDKHVSSWIYHLNFMRELRQSRFDLAIALHASFRTAWLAWVSGAPRRVVHNHSGRNHFSTLDIPAKKESKSAIQRDLDVVRALGVSEAELGEKLVFSIAERHFMGARTFLEKHRLRQAKRLMLLAPGAGKKRKQWPAEAVRDFLDHNHLDINWVIVAGPGEQEMIADISSRVKACPPIFQGNIKELGALMTLSQGVVTADSGPKHVAVAVGAPTLTLWTDEPEAEWHPYDLTRHALVRSPSGIVADISPQAVAQAVEQHFG